MRVVVTGATGNVGTSVLEALGADDRVASVLGLARRRPTWPVPKVTWAEASWRLHLQPTPPGWVDLAFAVPVMDTTRARTELGWAPLVGADDALRQLLDRDGARRRPAHPGAPPRAVPVAAAAAPSPASARPGRRSGEGGCSGARDALAGSGARDDGPQAPPTVVRCEWCGALLRAP